MTIYTTILAIQSILAGLNLVESQGRDAIRIYASYTHGWQTWPDALEMVITQWVTQELLEIASNTNAPGLSSRSVDGYMETYAASATTTQFSAIRIYYTEQAKKIMANFKKGLMG